MIDVKMIPRHKTGGTNGGSSTSSTTMITQVAKEAERAQKAGYADRAGQADSALYADNAGNAVHADNANVAHMLDRDSPVYDQFIRKDADDTNNGHTTTFGKTINTNGAQFGAAYAGGMTGFGGFIDGGGVAWLDELHVRHFMEVPELRYNRATVILGDQWHSAGGGIVESCAPDTDDEGNGLTTGTITLKLEDGEIGAVAVDDICMGYYHMLSGDTNATDTTDDSKGNRTMAGFTTIYFRVTDIVSADGTNKVFKYALRPVSGEWTTRAHPREALTFTAYGNFTDTDRQKSSYSTRTYTRYLSGVDNWTFNKNNIMMQFGDLSNLSVFGMNMTGYSAYLNNIYMSGSIQQFEEAGYAMDIDKEGYDRIAWGETMTVTCRVIDGYRRDRTFKVTAWKVERDSGDTAADTVWNAAHTDFAGSIDIHYTEAVNDIRRTDGVSAIFTFTATIGDEKVAGTLTT